MQAIKETKILIKDANGKEVNVGDMVAMEYQGLPVHAKFLGIGARGLWKFLGAVGKKDISFVAHPKGIKSMVVLGGSDGDI